MRSFLESQDDFLQGLDKISEDIEKYKQAAAAVIHTWLEIREQQHIPNHYGNGSKIDAKKMFLDHLNHAGETNAHDTVKELAYEWNIEYELLLKFIKGNPNILRESQEDFLSGLDDTDQWKQAALIACSDFLSVYYQNTRGNRPFVRNLIKLFRGNVEEGSLISTTIKDTAKKTGVEYEALKRYVKTMPLEFYWKCWKNPVMHESNFLSGLDSLENIKKATQETFSIWKSALEQDLGIEHVEAFLYYITDMPNSRAFKLATQAALKYNVSVEDIVNFAKDNPRMVIMESNKFLRGINNLETEREQLIKELIKIFDNKMGAGYDSHSYAGTALKLPGWIQDVSTADFFVEFQNKYQLTTPNMHHFMKVALERMLYR